MTQYVTYAPNEVIYKKGDNEDKFYVMLGGKVRIFDTENKQAEREETEFFGENACFKRGPRTQAATAVNRVSLMYFTTAAFKVRSNRIDRLSSFLLFLRTENCVGIRYQSIAFLEDGS